MARGRAEKPLLLFALSCAALMGVASRAISRQNPTASAARDINSSLQKVKILTPEDDAIVHPGEKLHVEVSLLPGMAVDGMALVSPLGISEEERESPPYSFTICVPTKELSNGNLIGKHGISVWGGRKGQNWEILGVISVDVEMSDLPKKLELWDGAILPSGEVLDFGSIGDERYLKVVGTFSDATELDLEESSYLKFTSYDASVLQVFENQRLVPVGPGKTSLSVSYSSGEKQMQIVAPVKVTVPANMVTPSPWTVDFGDVPVNTTSGPQTVTFTNQSDSPASLSKIDLAGSFNGSHDCADISLAPNGGTCTMTVMFSPTRTGLDYQKVEVSTAAGPVTSVFLIGRGSER